MAGAILAQFADLTDAADAWSYDMVPGSMRPETSDPQMVATPQAVDPPIFEQPVYTAGWKLVLDRIFRLGGNMGTPSGPPLNTARLRRKLTDNQQPIQSTRVAYDMPAGLIDDTPAYERFMRANPDDYLG